VLINQGDAVISPRPLPFLVVLSLFVSVCASLGSPQKSEANAKRLFIADYVINGAVGSAHTDSSGNTYGSAAAVGRNISLEATNGFMKNCPAVTVTNDSAGADYILRPNKGSSTLYRKNGDVVYVSHAKVKVSNLVKDVCGYIQSHP
jgi:hypothetical protein